MGHCNELKFSLAVCLICGRVRRQHEGGSYLTGPVLKWSRCSVGRPCKIDLHAPRAVASAEDRKRRRASLSTKGLSRALLHVSCRRRVAGEAPPRLRSFRHGCAHFATALPTARDSHHGGSERRRLRWSISSASRCTSSRSFRRHRRRQTPRTQRRYGGAIARRSELRRSCVDE